VKSKEVWTVLKTLRLQAGYSGTGFGKQVGLVSSQVNFLERGLRSIDPITVSRICRRLGVERSKVFYPDGSPKADFQEGHDCLDMDHPTNMDAATPYEQFLRNSGGTAEARKAKALKRQRVTAAQQKSAVPAETMEAAPNPIDRMERFLDARKSAIPQTPSTRRPTSAQTNGGQAVESHMKDSRRKPCDQRLAWTKLKTLREGDGRGAKNYASQLELARAFGLDSHHYISDYERRRLTVPTEIQAEYARLYNLPIDQLFDKESWALEDPNYTPEDLKTHRYRGRMGFSKGEDNGKPVAKEEASVIQETPEPILVKEVVTLTPPPEVVGVDQLFLRYTKLPRKEQVLLSRLMKVWTEAHAGIS
jgi:transcriptional regulator with XRE-family HTH domain